MGDSVGAVDATTATAELADRHGAAAAVCELQLRSFGGAAAFSGPISTVRCHEDNVVVKAHLATPGEGRVLVVDGAGSMRCALVGDVLAGIARASGWEGIVVNGCVRDSAALGTLPLGVKALGTHPRRCHKEGGGDVDVPVSFGGITFRPGAMLYADEDGIVVLAR